MDWMKSAEAPVMFLEPSVEPSTIALPAMIRDAMAGRPHPIHYRRRGKTELSEHQVLAAVGGLFGARLIYQQRRREEDSEGYLGVSFFAGDNTCASVTMGLTLFFNIVTRDVAALDAFCAWADEHLRGGGEDREGAGLIHALTQGPRGLRTTRLAVAGCPLERGNYAPEVVEAMDFVRQDLVSSSPSGRLVVLSGPPGTGKTHLVRSLLGLPKALFILVPSDLVASLGGPQMLPCLMETRDEHEGPIVLVLEDGDHAIVPRDGVDMSAVSSLLNLGDGILGAALDVRLLVTSNAPRFEMDKAVLRPGRLSRHIHVDALTFDHARRVFERLCPGATMPERRGSTPLAEVYAMARKTGWTPPPEPARVGFATESKRSVAQRLGG